MSNTRARTPFYGIKKMTAWLRTQGQEVNHKRVARLLRQMGLMAVYPAPRLSQPAQPAVRYPYLLRGLAIDRVNQVWSTDITYIACGAQTACAHCPRKASVPLFTRQH